MFWCGFHLLFLPLFLSFSLSLSPSFPFLVTESQLFSVLNFFSLFIAFPSTFFILSIFSCDNNNNCSCFFTFLLSLSVPPTASFGYWVYSSVLREEYFIQICQKTNSGPNNAGCSTSKTLYILIVDCVLQLFSLSFSFSFGSTRDYKRKLIR